MRFSTSHDGHVCTVVQMLHRDLTELANANAMPMQIHSVLNCNFFCCINANANAGSVGCIMQHWYEHTGVVENFPKFHTDRCLQTIAR